MLAFEHMRFEFHGLRKSAPDFRICNDRNVWRPIEPAFKRIAFHEVFDQIAARRNLVFSYQTYDSVVDEPARLDPIVTLFADMRYEPSECHKAKV